MRIRLLALLFCLAAIPAFAQVGGPGGFEKAAQQGSLADLSVAGYHAAMKMGYASVKKAADAVAALPAGEQPDVHYQRSAALGAEAWEVGELCLRALDSPVLAKELEEAARMANAVPGMKLHTWQQEFQQCVTEMRDLAIASLGAAVDATEQAQGRDEVMFQLGYFQAVAGKSADGAVTMQRLLKEHPQSDYVPEAWLMIAERRFEEDSFEDALKAFQEVDKHTSSRVRPYARYKAAWTLYNLQRFEEAYQALTVALDMCGPGSPWQHLYLEVSKDLPLFYAATERFPEEAVDAFQKLDRERAETMAERLAYVYADQGKSDPALNALESLVAAYPDAERRLHWRRLQVETVFQFAGGDALVGAVELLADDVDLVRKKFPPHVKKALPEIQEMMARILSKVRAEAAQRVPGAGSLVEKLESLQKRMNGE